MCHVWQHPTLPAEEVPIDFLAKLPAGFRRLVLTGGEPTLRADLEDIVDLVRPKTRHLEISTNGLLAAPLERIAARHPEVEISISIDGIGARNDTLRGEQDGYERKLATMQRLVAAGGRNIGLTTAIQDGNCDQLLDLYRLACRFGGEMAGCALHNGFLFHKADNEPANRVRTARAVQPLVYELLLSRHPRNWIRAYQHLGMMRKILGQPRRLPCPAGRDFLFVDPWGRVYACNIRPDLEIGDLASQTWKEIMAGSRAAEARTRVARCTHNCWLAGHARASLRGRRFPSLVRLQPLGWILANKLRAALGRPIDFDHAVDFRDVAHTPVAARREYGPGRDFHPVPQPKTEQPYGAFNNVMNK